MARAGSSLFEQTGAEEKAAITHTGALGRELGVNLDASAATESGLSLRRSGGDQPWSTCRHP